MTLGARLTAHFEGGRIDAAPPTSETQFAKRLIRQPGSDLPDIKMGRDPASIAPEQQVHIAM
jgi:hypothetical protein